MQNKENFSEFQKDVRDKDNSWYSLKLYLEKSKICCRLFHKLIYWQKLFNLSSLIVEDHQKWKIFKDEIVLYKEIIKSIKNNKIALKKTKRNNITLIIDMHKIKFNLLCKREEFDFVSHCDL